MKEKFYVFLDIDGVLWDIAYALRNLKTALHIKGHIIKNFKPKSIKALNELILFLQENFDVEIVISSSWRKNLKHAEKVLFASGLQYGGTISRTGNTPFATRGKEISIFLQNKKQTNNFVIIDDIPFGLKPHFHSKHIIKTSIFSALGNKQINKFINAFENNFDNDK